MDIKTADGASARGVLGQRGYRGVYCRPAALLARATAGDRPSGGRTRLGRNNGPPARERTARAEPRLTGGGRSAPAWGGMKATRCGGGSAVGAMVLAVVALSIREAAVPRTGATLVTAGVISGVAGTATSISGPPVALLYQDESGPRVRATLSAYFIVGNSIALAALALSGRLPARDVVAGLVFVRCATAGFAVPAGLRRFLGA